MNEDRAHSPSGLPLEPITIELPEFGHFIVRQGDSRCADLMWDEMIGQVIALTHPRIRMAHYPMLTDEQHEAERQRRERRAAERESGGPSHG